MYAESRKFGELICCCKCNKYAKVLHNIVYINCPAVRKQKQKHIVQLWEYKPQEYSILTSGAKPPWLHKHCILCEDCLIQETHRVLQSNQKRFSITKSQLIPNLDLYLPTEVALDIQETLGSEHKFNKHPKCSCHQRICIMD